MKLIVLILFSFTLVNIYSQSKDYFLQNRSWESLGPIPANMCSYGDCSGRLAFVKYDPSDITNNTIYIGPAGGGVWKTYDAGVTWQPLTDNLPSLSSGVFAIDKTNTDVLYYGTGEGVDFTVSAYGGYGIFKSTDAGTSWFEINNGIVSAGSKFYRIAIDPFNNNHLLVCSNVGLFSTTNGGGLWNKVEDIENLCCTEVLFSETNPGIVYLAGPSKQYYYPGCSYRISTDGGFTFTEIHDANFVPSCRTHLAISKNNPDIVYAVTNLGNQFVMFYKSTDKGYNFSPGSNIDNGYIQTNFNLFIFASPRDANLLYIGTSNLFRSTNGGADFKYIAGYGTAVHPDFHYMDFAPNDVNKIITANDGGVWSSSDKGDTWANLNKNLTLTQIYRIAVKPDEPEYIIGGVQDMGYQFRKDSNQWQNYICGGDGGIIRFSQVNPSLLVCIAALNGSIFNSNDGGVGMNGSFIPGMWDANNDWIAPLAIDPKEEGKVYTARRNDSAGYIFFYTSTDNGQNWNVTSKLFDTESPPNGLSPQRIAICNNDNKIIYMSTGSYFDTSVSQNLYTSSDGGVNWSKFENLHDFMPNYYITSIVTDNENDNIVYITLGGISIYQPVAVVFKSADKGLTWTNLTSNLPAIPFNNIVVLNKVNDKILIAGSNAGVFACNEISLKWKHIASGLPNSPATDLDYNKLSNTLYVSTFGRGVWRVKL